MSKNHKKKIAFIYPYEHGEKANKASSIRPLKIQEAFERVIPDMFIAKNGVNRFTNLLDKNLQGVYIESINRPFFIQRIMEKKFNIFKDYISIYKLKKQGVKLSIYYRDGFWAGDFLFELYSYPVALILRLFYRLEWQFIKNNFDHIYLPSLELAEYMGEKNKSKFQVLYPGCSPVNKSNRLSVNKERKDDITFLYAGGIIPPLNDISLLLKLLGNRSAYKIILVIRKNELEKYTKYYNFGKYANIDLVISKQGEQLFEYYSQADATLLLYSFHLYRYLAMPYKAFESISYGLPLISFSDNVMGEFIEHNKLGVSMSYADLDEFLDNKNAVLKKLTSSKTLVQQYANNNTWDNRVETIVNDLFSDGQ